MSSKQENGNARSTTGGLFDGGYGGIAQNRDSFEFLRSYGDKSSTFAIENILRHK